MISQVTWGVIDSLFSPDGESRGQSTITQLTCLPRPKQLAASSFSFHWRFNSHYESFVCKTVDLVIEPTADVGDLQTESVTEFFWPDDLREGLGTNTSTVKAFISNALKKNPTSTAIGIKLILPAQDGFVARSDIIELRMHGCTVSDATSGFLQPREFIEHFPNQKPRHEPEQLYDILSNCIGALLVNPSDFETVGHAMEVLENEFRYRLALEFLLPDAIPRQRVALVHCPPPELLTYEAIRCLGVDLVILDRPEHFLHSPKGPLAYLRESFHPIDLNVDDGLTQRIVNVAKDLKLDGIFTRYDLYSTQVAHAAELLGLPTSSPSAFSIATNKHASRMLEAEANSSFSVDNYNELDQMLRNSENPLKIEYPIVVKPCTGWSSLCVTKARDEKELRSAVRKAHSKVLGHVGDTPIQSRVLVEPYIDGPEVDVNFALWNGDIVFGNISDDFPCNADMSDKTGETDFQETVLMFPSRIPENEKAMLFSRLRDSLARMGFHTGVFHCEARVKNSAAKYVESEGTIDLAIEGSFQSGDREPSAFMIEVNPRPPGYFPLHATTWTHGVDYYALHVLRCVMDEKRFRALAVPFSPEVQPCMAVLSLMPEKGGILKSEDPAIALAKRKPSLMNSISIYRNYFEPGEYVTSPDAVETSFHACLLVESSTGRQDLLRKIEEIREEWVPIIE
ncbi:hypothetical protein V500_01047 [Pseudogymnoascus sp. VKM F-4518 (FW-2643)]|nr:hypothetical protein V500_01047 [Pseudogymnoascus sp. VKM F-4518 (FW-2643)]